MFYILHMDPILLCLLILHRLVLQFSIARTSRNIPALARGLCLCLEVIMDCDSGDLFIIWTPEVILLLIPLEPPL